MTPSAEAPSLRMDLPAPDVAQAIKVAELLADHNRASIMRLLADGPVCVCELAAALGQAQNNVSNHLAKLREAGLVRPIRIETDSRRVYYERDEDACARSLDDLTKVLT